MVAFFRFMNLVIYIYIYITMTVEATKELTSTYTYVFDREPSNGLTGLWESSGGMIITMHFSILSGAGILQTKLSI